MVDSEPQNDQRTYFAAERTFLAWLRTGLGLRGIALPWRASVVFRERWGRVHLTPVNKQLVCPFSGVALVLIGVTVKLNAVVRQYIARPRIADGGMGCTKVAM